MKIIGWGVVAVALLLPAAYSQRVMIGGKVGGQINNPIGYPPGPDSSSSEDRILFGPMMEVHATHGMSVEILNRNHQTCCTQKQDDKWSNLWR